MNRANDIVIDVEEAGYRNTIVFRDLHLRIPGYKITVILGPNGSGKTTLLRMLFKRVKYRGTIVIDFKELAKIHGSNIAKLLAYMGDISLPEMMGLRVFEALLISRSSLYTGLLEKDKDIREAEAVMVETGIKHLSDRRLSELSSGELRKVVLAMALVKRPKYLLLDEPDSHLDILSKIEISRLIKRYRGDTTIIMATHDPVFAVNTADYFILLRDGSIIDKGTIEEVIERKSIEKVFGARLKYVYDKGKLIGIIPIYD